MLVERIEGKWIDSFEAVFRKCAVAEGDICAILSESQSRPVNVQLAELALHRLGAKAFHLVIPAPNQSVGVPVRSTGASDAIGGIEAIIGALAATTFVVDCTVEGLLHAPELPQILQGGARILMISNEHPELLERMTLDDALEGRVKTGIKMLRGASEMTVSSDAGTDLTIDVSGAPAGGGWGWTTRPGTMTHWPGGLCLCFPGTESVNGILVLDKGDLNLTFKRYVDSPITLSIESDYVVEITGDGVDAELMKSYFAAWGDREAYATSHVGWGMNKGARWDAITMYDRSQQNGTEQRAFAGNFLYSTGANEVAGRHTLGHFDLPLRNCTVALDGTMVVDRGVLQGDLA
ncbi:MAG: peptidase M29 [Actinomycetia bacterium]|nr:peptidase M29 [Actinomycetes bacterium]